MTLFEIKLVELRDAYELAKKAGVLVEEIEAQIDNVTKLLLIAAQGFSKLNEVEKKINA